MAATGNELSCLCHYKLPHCVTVASIHYEMVTCKNGGKPE
jgi:hypothetical protein